MAAATTVAQVRRAIEVLGESRDPNATAVARALHRLLETDGETFESAFGLPGGWRDDARRQARDAALCDIAARYYAGLAGRPLARALHRDASRYESTAFPRDRRANRRPDGRNGAFFDVLRTGDLLSERQLLRVFNSLADPSDAIAMAQVAS